MSALVRKYLRNKQAQAQSLANEQSQSARKPLTRLNEIWRPWESRCSKIPCTFEDCTVTFKRESELKRHEHSVHQRTREICKYCLRIFTRKDNLTRHVKMKHRQSNKPSCLYCSKRLSRQDAVQRHMSNCSRNPDKLSLQLRNHSHSHQDIANALSKIEISNSCPNSSETDSSDCENRR